MSKKLYEEANISAIASAIRSKNGGNETYNTSEMASAILEISTEPDLEILSADANGTYYPSDGKDGFSKVVVNIPNIPNMGKRFCVTETVVSIQCNIDMIAVEVV